MIATVSLVQYRSAQGDLVHYDAACGHAVVRDGTHTYSGRLIGTPPSQDMLSAMEGGDWMSAVTIGLGRKP